ncbi:hypothetical protein SK128_019336, partial [Halocaridina rubra]
MIVEDSEDADNLITSSVTNTPDAITHVISSSKGSKQSTVNSKNGKRNLARNILKDAESRTIGNVSRAIDNQSISCILTATPESETKSTKNVNCQILNAESEEMMPEDGKLFTVKFNGDEIVEDESSQINHIIMTTEDVVEDSSSNMLDDQEQNMTETDKTHRVSSSDGDTVEVPGSFIRDCNKVYVTTEVTEKTLEKGRPPPQCHLAIKQEPLEEDHSSPIQIRVNASCPRKKDTSPSGYEVEEDKDCDSGKHDGTLKYTRVDRDDPRSRLHFVKYMKRDGKTIKIWECGICGKEFMHQYTLMRHLPTHTDERNFRCNICGKAFRQMSTLSQHKATHSESRPYVCDLCQKTFGRVSTLISHKKTHTEEKQHRCHVCGKAFHQRGKIYKV